MDTLGKRIRSLRLEKNISMNELARNLKLTPTTIGNIENDRHSPNSEIIIALAKFFNVTTDWLLMGVDVNVSYMDDSNDGSFSDTDKKILLALKEFIKEESQQLIRN